LHTTIDALKDRLDAHIGVPLLNEAEHTVTECVTHVGLSQAGGGLMATVHSQ
jgi:hypothetical protein